MLKNANNADTGHYTTGGGDQRLPPTWKLTPLMPAKCVGVCLVLWLHQTIAAVYIVPVKRAQFTTRIHK